MEVEAFSIKEGPTESGIEEIMKKIIPESVGGELIPINLLEAFPKHWILIFALILPAFIVLYKKRDLALNLISRII
jgi:hypothetical protein